MGLGQMLLFPIEAEPEELRAEPIARLVALSQPMAPKSVSSLVPKSVSSKPSLDQLRAQLELLRSRPHTDEVTAEPTYSAGGKVLDSLLPHGGLRQGTIVQWVGDTGGDCAASLATIAAAEIVGSELSGGKPLVIFDSAKKVSFYPPAASAMGIPANRMVLVKKRENHTHADMIWAIDQALRCEAVAAVWAELGMWLNDRDARRLQLAAEAGGTVGLFVRPAEVRRRPSFSDVSWFVTPHEKGVRPLSLGSARQLRVEIDRCRGGAEGAVAVVEIGAASAAERVVAIKPSTLTQTVSIRSKHESTMVSDLARRLAHPKTAKRESDRDLERDTKRAS